MKLFAWAAKSLPASSTRALAASWCFTCRETITRQISVCEFLDIYSHLDDYMLEK